MACSRYAAKLPPTKRPWLRQPPQRVRKISHARSQQRRLSRPVFWNVRRIVHVVKVRSMISREQFSADHGGLRVMERSELIT